ncbi:hypothetical protein C8F01DRAFT_995220, partial [Mycena amicta]
MEESGTLWLCQPCARSLMASEIPKFSLRNDLYRGQLPTEFSDLTWPEEMACCLYRTTAHVVRLFSRKGKDGKEDESSPRVFHGNVCAHEMNVVETAHALPRTPGDLNGAISVVFIGPQKFKKECLRNMFSIRKDKVWRFLNWLKYEALNPLYADIELSKSHLDQYADGEPIPGLEESVIHDEK